MNDGVTRNDDPAWYFKQGEEGVSPELLKVRALLLSLPKATCRTGFEFRLQRRIAGDDGRTERSYGVGRNWIMGWTGVGLGVATALVVAIVAFDFHFQSRGHLPAGSAPMTTGSASNFAAPPGVSTTPVSSSNMVQAPEHQSQPQQELIARKEPDKNAAKKDTLPPHTPTALPEDLYHTVGSSGR